MTEQVTPVRPDGFYDRNGNPIMQAVMVVLDGTTYHTLEALQALRNGYEETQKRKADLLTRVSELNSKYLAFQSSVRSAIAEIVSEDEMDRDKANELLESLDLERLAVVYEVELSIQVTGTVESTEDEDTVAERLAEYLEVDVSSWGSDYGWDTSDITTNVDSVSTESVSTR
jgi:hypothetical protein